MRIAVVNEASTAHRNIDIIESLKGFNHEVFNVGMKNTTQSPVLTYIHTGLMTALLLNLNAVDFVVGGCGTGQGYLNSAMQYPGVICGLISDSVDAWLFSQINAGNCISLALNKGYGWAGEINLKYIFEKLFRDEMGLGYPKSRTDIQKSSREELLRISELSHKNMDEILKTINKDLIDTAFSIREFCEVITKHSQNKELQEIIISQYIKR